MPDILKDRNYYRMLDAERLLDAAHHSGNELALAMMDFVEDAAREIEALKVALEDMEDKVYATKED